MDLGKELEVFLRSKDKDLLDHRAKHHRQLEALTDEQWWIQLVERTQAIRPEMLAIFERNKDEMIAGRHQAARQELEFREKMLRKKVQELLPFLFIVREKGGVSGNVTDHQVEEASNLLDIELMKFSRMVLEAPSLN